MYQYEYEVLDCTVSSAGFFDFRGNRTIINRRAEEGWRYVGYLPLIQTVRSGRLETIQLIFEKGVEEK